jgi:putative sugar O-methyltransferase
MSPAYFTWIKLWRTDPPKRKQLGPPSIAEQHKMDALRLRVRQLTEATAISESAAENAWLENRKEIRRLILQDDIRDFLNWDVMKRTMVFTPDIAELKHLKKLPDWNRWKKAISESSVGNPQPYSAFKSSSGNLIHHAYSLSLLMQLTKCSIENIREIFEFGGGYGSMCRLVHQLGFKGRYIIFDLPELCALQEYFLSSVGISNKVIVDAPVTWREGVVLLSDLNALSMQLKEHIENCAFIATWSISETGMNLRRQVLDLVANATYYLIAYQDNFRGIDNLEYFSRFATTKRGHEWSHFEIAWLRGNRYLIGRKIAGNSHDPRRST